MRTLLLFSFILGAYSSFALDADALVRANQAVARLNLHRKLCGLEEVELDLTLSDACSKHAAYLDLNPDQAFNGVEAHVEYPDRPGYTAEGAQAGRMGDVHYNRVTVDAVDNWFQTYYHRSPMVSPGVVKVGYGDNPGNNAGFTIAVMQFQTYTGPGDVLTPGDGSEGAAVAAYKNGETPQPVAGFGDTKGNPIIAYFAGNKVTWVSSTITANSQTLSHQVIAPNLPSNLTLEINEICLITDSPMPVNSTISVEINYEQDGSSLVKRWSFKTSNSGAFEVNTAAYGSGRGPGLPSIDTDGDGFLDELELATNSSPIDPNVTPFSGSSAGTPAGLTISKLALKFQYAKRSADTLAISGTLSLNADLNSTGLPFVIDVGGFAQGFSLDKRGASPKGDSAVKLALSQTHGTKFSAKISGDLWPSFLDEGLRNIDTRNALKNVKIVVLFNQTLFSTDASLSYSASGGKNGRARLSK